MADTNVPGYAPTTDRGLARTDMHCHHCIDIGKPSGAFIAQLDFGLNGNHLIICPRCGHEHYRFVKDGLITEQRWIAGHATHSVSPASTWTPTVVKQQNSVASQFLRDAWLNRSDW